MAHDRSEVHLAADLSAPPAHALEATAFRVAIVGDFCGRAGRSAAPTPLAKRRAWRIDRDDVDAVLARIAPEVRVTLDPSEPPLVVTFSALDDFHPDQLLRRLPLFQRLRALRAEVEASPAAPSGPSLPRPAQRTETVAAELTGGSLLDRIVEHAQGVGDVPSGQRPPAPRDDLSDFVAGAVRSHLVKESTPQQRTLTAKVDEVITATMRVLLHDPHVQALEALWRGVDLLVRRLETSETLQVYVIDVSREELIADLSSPDASRSALHGLLVDAAGVPRGERTWSLLAGAYTFGPGDANVLSRLAALGRLAGAPWVAAAHSEFFGVPSFAAADPDDWTLARPAAWEGLRNSADASFLGLAAPRFLVRVPYGKRGEECESFRFEEPDESSVPHESYLWGNPALLCALVIADGVAAGDSPATRGTIERLPLYVAPIDGVPTATPCAETRLSQRAVESMLDAGVSALVSPRDADTIVVPRIQSVASPLRALSVPSSVG